MSYDRTVWAKFVARLTPQDLERLDEIERKNVLDKCPFVDAVLCRTIRGDITDLRRLDARLVNVARMWREADDWDVPYDGTVHRGSYRNGAYYEPVECAKHGEMPWR